MVLEYLKAEQIVHEIVSTGILSGVFQTTQISKNKGNVSSVMQDEAFVQSKAFWVKVEQLALNLPKSLLPCLSFSF